MNAYIVAAILYLCTAYALTVAVVSLMNPRMKGRIGAAIGCVGLAALAYMTAAAVLSGRHPL